MNEQVIQDLYDRAVSLGYKKSKEEFISLLHSDASVQTDSFNYVKSKGYRKSMDEFLGLTGAPVATQMTVEKKKSRWNHYGIRIGRFFIGVSVSARH